ncbi:DUF6777 domain-containing protein [Streptomyces spectabilis]|uniref:DUF6777 domain-containing protein n=1 Tax=Streptomyces spectabilis TaxID=68270 RepID=A0A7W8EVX9_STRST|nr:DUF6777 domain-containing protein [Streptomyces spectabilis]MBB5105344.1 hypothetical protein [Streptomyces spectabilis]MCI3906537.1 hypothetical protein [Streptomyces spectabilis]GGV21064.1 hypothetical protein GCM10010245_35410 [Streptomyces spectabilis]
MGATFRTYATTFAIAAALAAAGCSGGGGDGTKDTADSGRELFLQPVAAQGPAPFTASTARAAASPPPVTRSPQPSPTGSASPTDQGLRSLAGGTPGLYGGTHRTGSCDVGRQIRFLTADSAKARAFAEASGIADNGIPSYLRGLTPVVLRADTRITNHGYRDGHATGFQSVLQAGTAVLVDDRGLPRVRCACGNPLKPPVAFRQAPRHSGEPWSGYRPTQVIVVTPAPRPITHITIINITNNTWIERRTGDEDGGDDRPVPPPDPTPTDPTDPTTPDETTPDETTPDETTPDETSQDPDPTGSDESLEPNGTDGTDGTDEGTTPGEDTTSTDCPTPGLPTPEGAVPSPLPPGCPSTGDPLEPDTAPPPGQDTGPGVGPETEPDLPGLPEGPTGPDSFPG